MNNQIVEDLRRNILNINDDILFKIGDMICLELYQTSVRLDINSHLIYDIIIELQEEGQYINEILQKFKDNDLISKMVLSINDIQEDNIIEYFNSLRSDVYNLLLCLKGYITEISYTHEICGEILYKEDTVKKYMDDIEEININVIYENVYKFLMKDTSVLSQKIIEFVSVIPLKISRNKYYDIIKNALLMSFNSNSEEDINIILQEYKLVLNGTMTSGYGQQFDKYFHKAHMLNQLDIDTLSIEDIKKLYKEIDELIVEINSIEDIIKQIVYLANRFVVLNILHERNYRFDKNKYRQILKLWDEYKVKDNKSIDKHILKKCSQEIKLLENKIIEYNKKSSEFKGSLSKELNTVDKNIDKDLAAIYNVIAYINDVSFERENFTFKESKEKASLNYLEQAVENFIEFINRNIKNMSNKQRKVRMRRLLCLTEFPFKDADDFFNYFKNSIETNAAKEDLITNIKLILAVMEKYNV